MEGNFQSLKTGEKDPENQDREATSATNGRRGRKREEVQKVIEKEREGKREERQQVFDLRKNKRRRKLRARQLVTWHVLDFMSISRPY